MTPKIYLAGPDVFYPEAEERGRELKNICKTYGLEGLFPLDNQLNLEGLSGPQKGMAIYKADVELINEADALIANLNPFRGISADPGTCFEMGYAEAQGKPIFAYTEDPRTYKGRARHMGYDKDGFELEDFGLADNLMLIGPTGNRVHHSFEETVKAVSEFFSEILLDKFSQCETNS